MIEEQADEHIVPLKKEATQESSLLIDKIMNTNGYNCLVWGVLIAGICGLIVDGMEMTLMSLLLIPLMEYYNIKDWTVQVISSILFLAVGSGSFTTGWLTKHFGRPHTITFFYLLIFISHLFMSLSENVIMFALFRFIIGFSLGVIIPILFNLITEILPIRFRGFTLNSMWLWFTVGQVILCLFILCFMPNLETANMKVCLVSSSFLTGTAFLTTLFLLFESPRCLILKNQKEKAFSILSYMKMKELSQFEKNKIESEVLSRGNAVTTGEFKDIFSPYFLRTTILVSSLFFINSFLLYGLLIISSLTMQALNITQNNYSNHQIILTQIFVGLCLLPSNPIGGALAEVPWIGRKMTQFLGFVFCTLSCILCFLLPQYFSIFYGCVMFFNTISFNVITVYGCEIYPTKLRDLSNGFLYTCTRVGGFLSQFIYLWMHSIHFFIPYYVSTALCVVGLVLTLLLPHETCNQPLDIDYSKKKMERGETDEEEEMIDTKKR